MYGAFMMQDAKIKHKPLPRRIKLELALREAALFQGQLAIRDFTRLDDLLVNPNDTVTVTLACKRDPRGATVIECHLHGTVHMICQRCMQPCPVELNVRTLLSPVSDDDAAVDLPIEYEPVIAPEGYLEASTLAEDEILLNLPLAPMHESKDCYK
jgi:uncharacterized protein